MTTRRLFLIRQAALRGIVGRDRERLEGALEEARITLLCEGIEDEINTEIHRAKLSLFASLESGPTGKILAGNLTDLRFEFHDDLIQALIPYVKMREDEKVVQGEQESRESFIKDFKEWVKNGCPV